MNIVGYIAIKGEQPCAFKNVTGSYRGGILVPAKGKEPVAFFNKPRDARRAIARSEAAAVEVTSAGRSLIHDWAQEHYPSFFDGEPFTVLPLGKQLAGLPIAKPRKKK